MTSGNTRTHELLAFCARPRSMSEIEAGGFPTLRAQVYRLEQSGHLKRKAFVGRGSRKPTVQWQTTALPYADMRGKRRTTTVPETGARVLARSGTYVSGAYLLRILAAMEAGDSEKARALVAVKLEQAERQRTARMEREADKCADHCCDMCSHGV